MIGALRLISPSGYVEGIAAYGIVTRIFSFTFMPLLAIALATQSVVGNNVGAKFYQRSNAVLRLALTVSVLYCAAIEVILLAGHGWIGRGFVTDLEVIAQVGNILRPMASVYLFAGPVLVLALYFRAIGKPGFTAALTLIKPFVLSPLLIAALGILYGGQAIWLVFPIADGIVVVIAVWVMVVGQGGAATTPPALVCWIRRKHD